MDTCSLEDILDHVDKLIEMVADHDDVLFGVTDLINQIRDEVNHLVDDQDCDD